MWLLNAHTYELEEFHGDGKPEYAILSHTWEREEVSFLDVRDLRQKEMQGWAKIESCCRQAITDDYAYIWADTCCIDKRNIVDLSEALNSMFRWYREAAVCYTYLSDVNANRDNDRVLIDINNLASTSSGIWQIDPRVQNNYVCTRDSDGRGLVEWGDGSVSTGSKIITSRWFSRGWTLQELLAPQSMVFFDASWNMLGTRFDCVAEIEDRTSIPQAALQGFVAEDYCVAQKMAWASGRRTTRPEDRAYSLLGLLGVSLNLIYGEGEQEAFIRLQRKLIKRLDDTSILAWNRKLSTKYSHWLLAPSPDAFQGCHIYQEYESCAYGLDLSKTALTGAFDFQIDCFDIGCACLGHFQACPKDRLPRGFEVDRDWSEVDSIGMLLVDLKNGSHQCAVLDGKQSILFKRYLPHGNKTTTRKQLKVSPISPASSQYSSWHSYRTHYPLKGDENTMLQICPAQFWSESDRERYRARAAVGPDGYQEPVRRLAPRDNSPLVISPGQERELRCFVICKPTAGYEGMVVHFWYDLHHRPTLREGRLDKRIANLVLDYGTFQSMESTDGTLEVAARRLFDGERSTNSVSAAQAWANSSAFHELMPGDYEDGNHLALPVGARILQLGDNIRVVFLPQDEGHRVLFAFRGNYAGFYAFPRTWLWPISPEAEISALGQKKDEGSLKTKFKGLFK